MREFSDPLPIDEVLAPLRSALASRCSAVLVAPPGAGKTTRVPLALLAEPWAAGRKLILLEPRRLAARAAADRMAAALGERVGGTVGLRVRLQSLVSATTRLEVVTAGVFARRIIEDPSLQGVAGVLFDEFHERSLDADMGLALALDAQAGLRPDLRLLVMSATLDAARVAGLLGEPPVIESRGRAHPVETHYLGRDPSERTEEAATRAILRALARAHGSILVFLPGQREIRILAEILRTRINDRGIDIAPLFGAMDRGAQDAAIVPAPAGRRKIVLATSIAETSLTIEGVRIVIDCGLSRVPRYEPDVGLTRLETVRVSRAAADQRRGRAARTEPGVCYRLWEEAGTGALEPFAQPEILAADVSGLMLDLAAWGVREPKALAWLDQPPAAAVTQARLLLQGLGAIDAEGAITQAGRALRALALPPRLARMVVEAGRAGEGHIATELAAVLSERGLGGAATDLAERIDRFRRDRSARAEDARRLARGWARQAAAAMPDQRADAGAARAGAGKEPSSRAGRLLALAYPERIAIARGRPGEFLMANGRAATLDPGEALARASYLAIAEVAGRAASTRILAAAALTIEELEEVAGSRIEARDEMSFDAASAAVRARRTRRLGAIVLGDRPLPVPPSEAAARLLAEGVAGVGLERLPWSKAQRQWCDRVRFLRRAYQDAAENPWPDVSISTLAASAADWLAPFLLGKTSLAQISAADLDVVLDALLPWESKLRLEREAPTHFEAPTGSRIAVDYSSAAEGEADPSIAVRVQELYGVTSHPSLAGGKIRLALQLLSPANRPIQVTRDLPAFWSGSWGAVKREMKGRYQRHFWPDDPANAAPTRRAKPRSA
ncbi:MAG: ATP-dependent helicase HrpB [Methylobacteriaceae bacterium]|nr:ATP-dependent helicase HrpB [Methylobacteriaceae bacterium]